MSSIGRVGVVYKGDELVVMVTTCNVVTIVNTCGEEILEHNIVIVLPSATVSVTMTTPIQNKYLFYVRMKIVVFLKEFEEFH